MAELRKTENIEKSYKENLQKIIDELKMKQTNLKFKLYKRILRLKKSFPEMHSENIAKFMTQKISLDDLKKKIKEAGVFSTPAVRKSYRAVYILPTT